MMAFIKEPSKGLTKDGQYGPYDEYEPLPELGATQKAGLKSLVQIENKQDIPWDEWLKMCKEALF